MAKLFQFSAFIGKFFSFFLCLARSFPLSVSLSLYPYMCVCSSIILSSCHDYSFFEFASTLLLTQSTRCSLSNVCASEYSVNVFLRCDLVNFKIFVDTFFAFPPSSLLIFFFDIIFRQKIDKVNFNAACFFRSKPLIFGTVSFELMPFTTTMPCGITFAFSCICIPLAKAPTFL